MKKLNYKLGAYKRKFKLGNKDFAPGTLISKVNETKIKKNNAPIPKTKLAIMGLV